MRLQIADCRLRIGVRVGARIGVVCLAALIACAGLARADELVDRVLAVVGGEMITLTDVTAARDLGLVTVPQAANPIRAILSRLIDRELILAEVDRYAPPEPTSDAVDREARAVRDRFDSDAAFQRALQRSGLDEKHLRETLRENLRIQAYLDQRFAVPAPSEEELRAYYDEHRQAFAHGTQERSFDDVRPEIVEAIVAARRKPLVDDWVAGLRRRGDITDLYITAP
jgi:peptidyl-prolyl cis-trans isomerase SurA